MKEKIITTEPVREQVSANAIPEFGRWKTVEQLFGIKRGTLYNLMAEGKIKSVSMRRKGNLHGCRLIYLQSVRDYLNSLMEAETKITAPTH